jgi:hypothetical protein
MDDRQLSGEQHRGSFALRWTGRTGINRFIESWTDNVLLSGLVRLILIDVFACLREKVRAYFRSSREQRLGMALEAACADREHRVIGFRQSLEVLRTTLKTQPFMGGEATNYGDYLVLGGFHVGSEYKPFKLLSDDDPITLWRERLLARFEDARKAPGYDT